MILAKCHDKIRKINKTTHFRECTYDIPWFIPGYPGYDLEHANKFLINHLRGVWGDEKDFSAEQQEKKEQAWFQAENGYQERPQGALRTTRKGSSLPERQQLYERFEALTLARHRAYW